MLLVAALLASGAAVVTPQPGTPVQSKPICRNPGIVTAGTRGTAGIRPLGSEPPARQIKAVVREIDGCNTPIVVNAEVGAPRR